MQVVERSALVTFTPAQMFALVNDVPRYPEFLPWCIGVRVEDVSATERIAMLKIAHGVLADRIHDAQHAAARTRRSTCASRTVRFAISTGAWRFDAIGERGCRVHFRVRIRVQEPPDRPRHSMRCSRRCAAASSMPSWCARKRFTVRSRAVIRVEIVYAEPQRSIVKTLSLAPGRGDCRRAELASLRIRIFRAWTWRIGGGHLRQGRRAAISRCKDGDRIEIYRPLLEEPEARAQNTRRAGIPTGCPT